MKENHIHSFDQNIHMENSREIITTHSLRPQTKKVNVTLYDYLKNRCKKSLTFYRRPLLKECTGENIYGIMLLSL